MSRRTAEYVVSTAFADILEGYGLNASPHPQLQSGEPDVFVRNRGTRVVVELKKSGSGQRDALISQMEERIEDGMGEVVFGVLFPSEIVEAGFASPTVSEVKSDLYDATLDVWVATNTTGQVDPSSGFTAEIGDFSDLIPRFTSELLAGEQLDETVELVEETAHGFVANLLDLEDPESLARDIESTLEGLGDSARDEDDSMSTEEIQEYLVSGGLILFNATAFYGLLAQSKNLQSIRSRLGDNNGVWSQAMREAFLDALEINYVSVFLTAEKILDELPSAPAVNNGLNDIHSTAETVLSNAGLLRQDLTGRVYHSTLGRTLAKNYATYYTQIPSGELLAWLGLQDWDAKVGEFACGSGTLVTSSYHRKMNLAFEMVEDEETGSTRPKAGIEGYGDIDDIHQKFVEDDIWGLDAMSFAAHLTAVNLALQQPDVPFEDSHIYQVPVSQTNESRLGSLDLLNSSSVKVQTQLESEDTSGAGRQSMAMTEVEELRVPKGEYDLVIMNPPFTRTDRASKILDLSKLNTILREEFDERDYANTTRAGLAAPFAILGDEALAEGGRLALVVPSSLLSRETWQPVRDFLRENYHLEHIVVNWAQGEPAFSENTDLREVLIVARKLSAEEKDSGGDQPTLMTHIDKPIDFLQSRLVGSDLNDEVNKGRISIQRPQADLIMDGMTQLAEVKSAPKAITEQTVDNWYRLVAFRDHDLLRLMLTIEGTLGKALTPYNINLPESFDTLGNIGDPMLFIKNVSTAGYSYSDDEVPGGVPVIRTSRYNKISAGTGDGKWIYDDPNKSATEDTPLNEGQLLVMRKMDMWNTMRVCAIATDDDIDISGSMWIPVDLDSFETTDGEEYTKYEAARVISSWLNSTFGMVPYIGYRAETRGAYGEWKTNQVRRISALDPATLTSEQVDTLLDAYEEVRNREWDLLRNQMDDVQSDEDHERRVLDEKVAEALFVNEEENDGETDVEEEVDFDSLYEDFNNTLTKLGELMD
ncbi:Eco57I restriction-modification methylase domain-containing protein [Halorubrum ezzemoulense]|uniref:Eco57I restriction-modification methylase domain-containing protein n=1 Tax=Halorubrum ezzemoulense TaxID=337243 RepID=UPI00232B8236|nr:N-6 DNA methylase [Halorubrum ezzemoulense]MDB2237062.1 N-6 DNA methylase [Halorubrum ezzemoulense]